jgi:ABC-2 type transport system permease protein
MLLLRPFRSLVRVSAFVGKEISEIMRQPRLILTLVLGPFLILALFGVGYKNQARALRTLFVAQPNSTIGKEIQQYATTLGPQLIYAGTISSETEARNRLLAGNVDVVIVVPPNADQALANNQQATFTLLHNEIDPQQVDYVKYFGQVYIDEVNRRVLQQATAQEQTKAPQLQQDLSQARTSAQAMRTALQRGDAASARQNQRQLDTSLGAVELAVGAGGALLGGSTPGNSSNGQSSSVQSNLSDARQGTNSLSNVPENQSNYSSQIQRLDKIDQDLASLQTELTQFQNVSPAVLVSPFKTQAQGIATVQPDMTDYFAPAVIVLLLQHLTVTLAALSIVRERQHGTMELFRVAPLSAIETLLGKYISYMIFGGVIGAILSALLIYALGVPMLGQPQHYVLALAALLFTSLGYGFVISLISQTDSQAVQWTMLVLLTSVFFSGFILPLSALILGVRIVSWTLPATYAISLLQNIMLRGYLTQPYLLAALAAIGLGLFLVSWLLLRRQMARA